MTNRAQLDDSILQVTLQAITATYGSQTTIVVNRGTVTAATAPPTGGGQGIPLVENTQQRLSCCFTHIAKFLVKIHHKISLLFARSLNDLQIRRQAKVALW